MDLSKLRRVSGDERGKAEDPADSPAAQNQAKEPPVPVDYQPAAPHRDLGAGPEIWLSLFVGVILMYLGGEFARWAFATLTGATYDTGVVWRTADKNGQMVPYWQIMGHQALSDSAVFLFGFAMVLEVLAMTAGLLIPRLWRPAVFIALMMSILMTLYNALAAVILLGDKQTPLLSLLAIGFGGYMAMVQWRALCAAQ